jgi:hypothetical protein
MILNSRNIVVLQQLPKLVERCHKASIDAGWYTDVNTGLPIQRNVGEMVCLIHSEISEGMEGVRKNLLDTHLPHRLMIEVELADAVIRIADLMGYLKLDAERGAMFALREWGEYEVPDNVGAALARIHHVISNATYGDAFHDSEGSTTFALCLAVLRIAQLADKLDLDVWSAIAEKMAYNAQRADHKIENRKAAGGKAF